MQGRVQGKLLKKFPFDPFKTFSKIIWDVAALFAQTCIVCKNGASNVLGYAEHVDMPFHGNRGTSPPTITYDLRRFVYGKPQTFQGRF